MNQITTDLKNRSLELRKARDPMGAYLATVLGEASALAKHDTKDGVTPELNDEYVMRSIRKFLATAEENIKLYSGNPEHAGWARAQAEKALLTSLLPAQAGEAEVRAVCVEALEAHKASGADMKKVMGSIMKALGDRFGASLDRKMASQIAQEVSRG